MTSKIDDEMAKWYRDKQAKIDKAMAARDAHTAIPHNTMLCKMCRHLRDALEKARYYGD